MVIKNLDHGETRTKERHACTKRTEGRVVELPVRTIRREVALGSGKELKRVELFMNTLQRFEAEIDGRGYAELVQESQERENDVGLLRWSVGSNGSSDMISFSGEGGYGYGFAPRSRRLRMRSER